MEKTNNGDQDTKEEDKNDQNKLLIFDYQKQLWKFAGLYLLFFATLILIFLIIYLFKDEYYDATYDVIRLDSFDPDAKCLDGSPGVFLLKKGQKDKFVFFFEGGAWCGDLTNEATIQNCYKRSKTTYGSSLFMPKEVNGTNGIFYRDPRKNPSFYNHTTIGLKYCDGGGHQSYMKDPVIVDSTNKIWFRGHNITTAALKWAIQNLNFGQASEVIVAGSSAGGVAALTWVNFISDLVKQTNPSAKIYCIADSGIFLDNEHYGLRTMDYRTKIQNLVKITNKEIDPVIPECASENSDNKWKCLFSDTLMQYIKTPVFIIQPLYDDYGIEAIMGITCLDNFSLNKCNIQEKNEIEKYRTETLNIIYKYLRKQPSWGHIYLATSYGESEVPQNSGFTIVKSIQQWMENLDGQNIHIDNDPWPSNAQCSNQRFL